MLTAFIDLFTNNQNNNKKKNDIIIIRNGFSIKSNQILISFKYQFPPRLKCIFTIDNNNNNVCYFYFVAKCYGVYDLLVFILNSNNNKLSLQTISRYNNNDMNKINKINRLLFTNNYEFLFC